jgi:hypothetical protein
VPSGYLIWRVGPIWHARSNVYRTPGEAAAWGVRWGAVAWSLQGLHEALGRREEVNRGAHR